LLHGTEILNQHNNRRRTRGSKTSKALPEKKKPLKCDFEGCQEMVQWYRRYKGKPLKLCTKHEARMAREHKGYSLDPRDLTPDDWQYLIEKDEDEELGVQK
jgi:hypothetical protein